MSASQRKRRGGAVNSRQARKRNRLVASTAEMASEAEPIELEESGAMRSPPVTDELCKKGAQVLLSHLKAASDELGVTAAAAPDDGRVSLGAPKFEEDNSKFIISRAPSLKGEAVLAGEEVVDLTCESSEPVVVDLTHNDSVVIVEENQRQRRNLRLRSQRQSDSCVLSSDDEDEARDNDVYVTDKVSRELGPLEDDTASSKPSGTVSCPICMDGYSEIVQSGRLIVSTKCGHVFCSQCLRDSLRNANSCPTCRKKLTHRQYHPIYI